MLTAFFLEATFLGILLFGASRVPDWLHLVAAFMVAFGTCISAFWILAANSWMQYPVGHEVRNGIAYPVDWLQIVFSPTFPGPGMVVAAYLTTAIVVMSVGAFSCWPADSRTRVAPCSRWGSASPWCCRAGPDFHRRFARLVTAKYQPAKLAAMEGHWESNEAALFGSPNQASERNDFDGPSYLAASSSPWTQFPGLKDFPPQDRPPVAPSSSPSASWSASACCCSPWHGGYVWKALSPRAPPASPSVRLAARLHRHRLRLDGDRDGRQPWVATGILRTVDARSPIPAGTVATSLALFIAVYGIVFWKGIGFINKLIVKGPDPVATADSEGL